MIFVIVPLGKTASDIKLWVARVIVYVIASVLGGASVGLVFAALGVVLRPIFQNILVAGLLLGVIALLYAANELGWLPMPAPQSNWQVPNSWGVERPIGGTFLYGYLLGAGTFTFIPYTSFYVLLAWYVLAGNIGFALLLGALYGLGRGGMVVFGGLSEMGKLRGRTLVELNTWILDRKGQLKLLNGTYLAFLAATLLTAVALLVR